jgi:DNA-directed RNA polymerase subunit omega
MDGGRASCGRRQQASQGPVNRLGSRDEKLLERKGATRGGGFGYAAGHGYLLKQRILMRQAHLAILLLRLELESLLYCARLNILGNALNAELTRKALEKVGNPNVLVNLVSRRVRQLNAGSGAMSRPLVSDTGNLGAADIALLEIIEEKIGFEMPEITELTRPVGKKRKKH